MGNIHCQLIFRNGQQVRGDERRIS